METLHRSTSELLQLERRILGLCAVFIVVAAVVLLVVLAAYLFPQARCDEPCGDPASAVFSEPPPE